MWRYTLSFIIGAAFATYGFLKIVDDAPVTTALLIVAGTILLGHELVVRGLIDEPDDRKHLKLLLQNEPGFSRWLYILGLLLGAGGAAVSWFLAHLWGFVFHISMVSLLLPFCIFICGLLYLWRVIRLRVRDLN